MASSEQHARGVVRTGRTMGSLLEFRAKRDPLPLPVLTRAVGVGVELSAGQPRFKGGQAACTYLVLCYPRDAQGADAQATNLRAWFVPGALLESFVLDAGLNAGEALQVSLVCPLLTWDAHNRERQLPCYQSRVDGSPAILGGCNVPPIPSAGIYGLVSARAPRGKSRPSARARARRGRARARRAAGRSNGVARLDAR